MSEVSFSVLGMPELEARLLALPGVVLSHLVKSGLTRGSKVIMDAVKAAVPRDTNALYRSLKRGSATIRRGVVSVRIWTGDLDTLGYRRTKRLGARGGRGRQGFPPAAIEFGYVRGGRYSRSEQLEELTDRIGRKRAYRTVKHSTTGGTPVPARSFIRAPLEANRQKAIDAIAEDLGKGIEKEMGSGAGAAA